MPDAATLPQEQTSVEGQAEVHRPPEHGEEVSATSVWLYALVFEFGAFEKAILAHFEQ